MSDLRTDARQASRGGEGILVQLRRIRDRILNPRIDTIRLFMDETGTLRAGAAEWLQRLAADNFVRETTHVPGDREQTLINEGRRQVVLEILASVRLDPERLDEINAQIKEMERGGR